MSRCPLLFTFKDIVSGNGFLTDIEAHGRILGVQEGGGVWMYGVRPGGLAAGGKDEGEAYLEFRQAYRSVLYDIAEEASDFPDFKGRVERFFRETCEETENEWREALTDVREGRLKVEGLLIKSADSKPYIKVKRMQRFTAKDNALEPQRSLAA